MSDLIRIVDLEVQARIGVPEEERAQPQRLLITLDLSVTDFRPAAAGDNVALTVDYSCVAERIKGLLVRRQCKLLETLAEEVAADLLKTFPIEKIGLEIKKFVLPGTRYVSVRIDRHSTHTSRSS